MFCEKPTTRNLCMTVLAAGIARSRTICWMQYRHPNDESFRTPFCSYRHRFLGGLETKQKEKEERVMQEQLHGPSVGTRVHNSCSGNTGVQNGVPDSRWHCMQFMGQCVSGHHKSHFLCANGRLVRKMRESWQRLSCQAGL